MKNKYLLDTVQITPEKSDTTTIPSLAMRKNEFKEVDAETRLKLNSLNKEFDIGNSFFISETTALHIKNKIYNFNTDEIIYLLEHMWVDEELYKLMLQQQ